jgi:hypothetical protein
MTNVGTNTIGLYPWAAPTAGQRAWFDALSPGAKRRAIAHAIKEGFRGPPSFKTIDEIIRQARAEVQRG